MSAALSLWRRLAAWPVLWLTAACLACLAPFVNKAFHIDDTLFLYAARQIQINPLDFYGFKVNWYGSLMPMGGDVDNPRTEGVMQNPPLASYYLAGAAAILGWSEAALHLAFLLPAIFVVWGTYRLAERLCTRPVLATLATLFTPAFLVSSTNVMCDTPTLAFWVWTLVFWERGLRLRRMGLLFLAATLLGLAALTKYIGVALIPLLLAYTVAYQVSPAAGPGAGPARQAGPTAKPEPRRDSATAGKWLTDILTPCLPLAIPIFILVEYQQFTETLYGHGLFFHAVGYAAAIGSAGYGLVAGLCFVGGSAASVLFFTPACWSGRQLLIGLGLVAVLSVGLGLAFLKAQTIPGFSFGQTQGTVPQVPWLGIVQFAIFTIAGLNLAALTGLDLWQRRDAESLLLALWIGGIFLFATALNWTLNVRSLLPLVPAAGIVVARRLDWRLGPARAGEWRSLAWPLVPACILALLVTWADYKMAGAAREAAADIVAASANHPGQLWFQGHWGFQYYMEMAKARPVDVHDFPGKPPDLIVYPANNSNVHLDFPPLPRKLWREFAVPTCPWLASFDPSVGASFYAAIWGPLPFAFGKVQPSRYAIVELAPESAGQKSPQ